MNKFFLSVLIIFLASCSFLNSERVDIAYKPLVICKHYDCSKSKTGWHVWWPKTAYIYVGRKNDVISQITVNDGLWEFYEHRDYDGRCLRLSASKTYKLKRYNFNDIILSLKPVGAGQHYKPNPACEVPPYI